MKKYKLNYINKILFGFSKNIIIKLSISLLFKKKLIDNYNDRRNPAISNERNRGYIFNW